MIKLDRNEILVDEGLQIVLVYDDTDEALEVYRATILGKECPKPIVDALVAHYNDCDGSGQWVYDRCYDNEQEHARNAAEYAAESAAEARAEQRQREIQSSPLFELGVSLGRLYQNLHS
jgi:hypothetical protein